MGVRQNGTPPLAIPRMILKFRVLCRFGRCGFLTALDREKNAKPDNLLKPERLWNLIFDKFFTLMLLCKE